MSALQINYFIDAPQPKEKDWKKDKLPVPVENERQDENRGLRKILSIDLNYPDHIGQCAYVTVVQCVCLNTTYTTHSLRG